MINQIEIGQEYFLDGESPVKVLKAIFLPSG